MRFLKTFLIFIFIAVPLLIAFNNCSASFNAEGDKQEAIARSEGEKQRRINEATGMAAEIELVAVATAKGIVEIARSINTEGGISAVNLRIAEQYLTEFGKLAKTNNSMIVPADLSDIAGILSGITSVLNKTQVESPLIKKRIDS